MVSVRRRDTVPELLLRRRLWHHGWRYRLNVRTLPGSPDIVFVRQRVAVFVDGDFWHGRIYVERGLSALQGSLRTERRDWWVEKLLRNCARDRRVDTELRARGWRVVRLWEKDIVRDPDAAAGAVQEVLRDA